MSGENESRPGLQSDQLLELTKIIRQISTTKEGSPMNLIARYNMSQLLFPKKEQE